MAKVKKNISITTDEVPSCPSDEFVSEKLTLLMPSEYLSPNPKYVSPGLEVEGLFLLLSGGPPFGVHAGSVAGFLNVATEEAAASGLLPVSLFDGWLDLHVQDLHVDELAGAWDKSSNGNIAFPFVDFEDWTPNVRIQDGDLIGPPDSIPGNTSTTVTVSLVQTWTDWINTEADQDWFRVDLAAGQTYRFMLTGAGPTPLTDSILTLYNSSGGQLAQNDDFRAGTENETKNSSFLFTPSSSGTYFLSASAWAAPSYDNVGQYTLSVTAGTGFPQFSLEQIAAFLINGYWEGDGFNFTTQTLTYNVQGLTNAGRLLARAALDQWSDVANIDFVETSGSAQITFDDSQTGAFASNNGTTATVNVGLDWLAAYGTSFDSYSFQTYIHEIGHALGLGHAGPYNGSAAYGVDNFYTNDVWSYSIMSYFDQAEVGFGSYRFVLTPMLADIVAIQYLYGAPQATRSGDTTYGFNSNAGDFYSFSTYASTPSLTIFDTGGLDTLDASGYTQAQTIDLSSESFSSLGGISKNITIARGSIIENAIGGSGNDILRGNTFNNFLNGKNGNDQLFGEAGDDSLEGGAGNDTINGGTGVDIVVYSGAWGSYVISSGSGANQFIVVDLRGNGDGSDTLIDVEFLAFSDQTVPVGVSSSPLVSISAQLASAAEGQPLSFTVQLSQALSSASSVQWSVSGSGGQPATGADFMGGVLPSGTLSFAGGETSKTLTIGVLSDTSVEADETFLVTLANPGPGISLGQASAAGAILNDDAALANLTTLNASAVEGQPLTFTVQLSQALSSASSVQWSVSGSGGQPATGADFMGGVLPSGMLSFAAGETSKTLTIGVLNDTSVEADETFLVTLASPGPGISLGQASAAGAILNDDAALANLTTLNASAVEGQPLTFTVQLSQALSSASSVQWSVSGSGGQPATGADFMGGVLPSGMLSFAAGETSKTLTIGVLNDTSVEADETFLVTLANPGPGIALGQATVAGAILNDDAAFANLSTLNASAVEGQPLSFTVQLSQALSSASSVQWSVSGSGGQPATGADFMGGVLPSGTLSFAGGETSKTLTIGVLSDTSVEADETFLVTLANPGPGISLGQATAAGAILNDDAALANLTTLNASAVEGQPLSFTVQLSQALSSASSVQWSVSGSGGQPATGADFMGGVLPSGMLSFAAGETSKTLTIGVLNDTSVEADETFLVTLANPGPGISLGQASVAGAILNDDAALANLTTLNASAVEGQPLTFTVQLSQALSSASSVQWSVSGSGGQPATGADFMGGVLPSGMLSFAAGETSKTLTIGVLNDTSVEADETFLVTLASPGPGISLGQATAAGAILNDDAALANLTTLNASAVEGQPLSFTVQLSQALSSASSVQWSVSGSGGQPATGADFMGGVLPSGMLSFAAGETSKTLTIGVLNDTSVEADETFLVTLANPGPGISLGQASAAGAILNDDYVLLDLLPQSISPGEGNGSATTAEFIVQLSAPTANGVSVRYVVIGAGPHAADGADFAGGALPSGIIAFGPGDTIKTLNVAIAGDTNTEADERFFLTLVEPSAGILLGLYESEAIILNDDAAQVSVAAAPELPEGNQMGATFVYRLTLSQSVAVESAIQYEVVGVGPRAATSSDFVGGFLPSGVVTFGAGETSKDIVVLVAGDELIEFDESFQLILAPTSARLVVDGAPPATLILNDDLPLATDFDDTIFGTRSNDSIAALKGNDVIHPGGGNDTIDGGPGTDRVVYAATRSAVSVDYREGGNIIVEGGPEFGRDTLTNIEKIEFQNGVLVFDIPFDDDAVLVYRLYQASFARTPDEAGFRFWYNAHEQQGLDFYGMADYFRTSAEFTQKYGAAVSNNSYVYSLYSNVLQRQPDTPGLLFWQDVLNSGYYDRNELMLAFARSPENVQITTTNIEDGYWLT